MACYPIYLLTFENVSSCFTQQLDLMKLKLPGAEAQKKPQKARSARERWKERLAAAMEK